MVNAANVVESEPTSPFVALFANMLVERRKSRFVTPRLRSCKVVDEDAAARAAVVWDPKDNANQSAACVGPVLC